MPALLGGLFIGVLSALPIISCCCCLWIAGGGFLAAYLQSQNQPTSLTVAQGARLGVLAGIVGSIVWVVVDTALRPLNVRFVGELLRNASDVPPEVRDIFESVQAGQMGGNVWGILGGFILFLVVCSILSTLGGMAGAAYLRKDVPPALGGPINPPPLP
jgi:uncharacterized membrane protein (UPF0136 family)